MDSATAGSQCVLKAARTKFPSIAMSRKRCRAHSIGQGSISPSAWPMTASARVICSPATNCARTPRAFSRARGAGFGKTSDDPDEANRECLRRGQKRISRQLWHLGPKIMEVDAFLRAHRALDVREVHPELVFLRLNANKPLPSKKSEEGDSPSPDVAQAKRASAISTDGSDKTRIGTGAKRDDVLDACAVAIAAREPAGSVGSPSPDAHGLPMQIWF